jgi:formiminotetrahydrofolate cyclodeaminase
MSHSSHLGDMAVAEFLGALASKSPTPGGGAAAAVTLAQAAALGSMVVAYTEGKSKWAAHAVLHAHAASFLAQVRLEALALADRDASAYRALNAMWGMPREERSRDPRWSAALDEAIAAPSAIADLACATIVMLARLDGRTSALLASDLRIARLFADTALEAALANVEVNVPMLDCSVTAESIRIQCASRRALSEAHGAAHAGGHGAGS